MLLFSYWPYLSPIIPPLLRCLVGSELQTLRLLSDVGGNPMVWQLCVSLVGYLCWLFGYWDHCLHAAWLLFLVAQHNFNWHEHCFCECLERRCVKQLDNAYTQFSLNCLITFLDESPLAYIQSCLHFLGSVIRLSWITRLKLRSSLVPSYLEWPSKYPAKMIRKKPMWSKGLCVSTSNQSPTSSVVNILSTSW